MKDGAPAHVIPDRGVTAFEDFLRERCGPLSVRCAGESAELPQGEVARVDRNDIEKTGLRFGVAEFLDPFDVVCGKECRSRDRKSTRLNSSHQIISYAVFCLKKKKI